VRLVDPQQAYRTQGALRFVAPTTAYAGMPVFAPFKAKGRVGLVPCKIVTVTSSTVRCVSDDPKFDIWFKLAELKVPVQAGKP